MMESNETDAKRTPVHRRQVTVETFRRDDGLWDVEGRLVDTRATDLQVDRRLRRAGEPFHSMWLRLTIDRDATIVGAVARSEAVPYEGSCEAIEPAYGALVGLRVGPGYRAEVRRRFASIAGCSHMTELASSMGPAIVQALATEVATPADTRPFALDGCHALATDGKVVATYYPRWYRAGGDR